MAIQFLELLPLIIYAAAYAYDTFVEKPRREEERARLEEEYQRWLSEYRKFLERPVVGYPPEAIERAYREIEKTLSREMAEIRPRILQDLAARGVLRSGIAEYPLMQLERERLSRLGAARERLELERLLAERQERLNREAQRQAFLAAQVGATQPLYQQAMLMGITEPAQRAYEWGRLAGLLASYYLPATTDYLPATTETTTLPTLRPSPDIPPAGPPAPTTIGVSPSPPIAPVDLEELRTIEYPTGGVY